VKNDTGEFSWSDALYAFFGHARFAKALSVSVLATFFSLRLLTVLLGNAGVVSILLSELLLAAVALLSRRRSVAWSRVLPVTVGLYLGWAILSLVWSNYLSRTALALLPLIISVLLALALSALRDTLQIVRSLGDVLRVMLGLSLALEILSGLLIDIPFTFLGIQGNLGTGGPIQGIYSSRTTLTLVALMALTTFLIERHMKSVRFAASFISFFIAGFCFLFSATGVSWTILLLTALSWGVISMLRRVPAQQRRNTHIALGATLVIAFIVLWATRSQVVALLNTQGLISARIHLWQAMWSYIKVNPLIGWGWVGPWPEHVNPYGVIEYVSKISLDTGLNAYLDLWLQLGLIGLCLFGALLAFGFVRGWILATAKKSKVFIWLPLMFIILALQSLIGSDLLAPLGIFTLTLIAAYSSAEFKSRKR